MYVNERICFLFFFWKQQCAAWYSGIKSLPVDKTRRVRLIRRLPVTKQSWRTSLKLFHLKLVKLKSAGGAENNTKRCTLNTTSRKRCRERIFKLFFGFKFFWRFERFVWTKGRCAHHRLFKIYYGSLPTFHSGRGMRVIHDHRNDDAHGWESERGIRRSEVRFFMGTQNFFYVALS